MLYSLCFHTFDQINHVFDLIESCFVFKVQTKAKILHTVIFALKKMSSICWKNIPALLAQAETHSASDLTIKPIFLQHLKCLSHWKILGETRTHTQKHTLSALRGLKWKGKNSWRKLSAATVWRREVKAFVIAFLLVKKALIFEEWPQKAWRPFVTPTKRVNQGAWKEKHTLQI